MKLKSFLLSAVVALTAFSANASSDEIRILHTGGKTGSTSIIANEYATEFKTHYKQVDSNGPGGCVPVLNEVRNKKEPTVVIWDTGALPNEQCYKELTSQPVVATYGVYFLLCTSADNNFTINDFLKGGSRVALSTPYGFWQEWHTAVGKQVGVEHKSVPVGDSGKLILSLISKETDWAVLNGQKAYKQIEDKKLTCVATTNPNGENGYPSISKYTKGFDKTDLILGWGVYVANASADEKAKIEKIIVNLHKSDEFKKFMNKGHISDYTNSAEKDKNRFFNSMIKTMK